MMKNIVSFLIAISIFTCICSSEIISQNHTPDNREVINPILIDINAISGLNLKPVTNSSDPERRLFQKQVLRGSELSVYVVSSETKAATHESYGIDEFLYLINGRARLNQDGTNDIYYHTGDFFVVPKGYHGEWETQGGNEFLIELSVISTPRSKAPIDPNKTSPYLIDKAILSGIGISPKEDSEGEKYSDELYHGAELDVSAHAEEPNKRIQIDSPSKNSSSMSFQER